MIKISKTLDAATILNTDFYPRKDWLFFDIETTGFSAKKSIVYLIGCIFLQDDKLILNQWLASSANEEAAVLAAFYQFLASFGTLLNYNGDGFDIPYLKEKARNYQIPLDFDKFNNIDIYKNIKPYKKQLKLENLKQKTIEQFIGIEREDTKSGGELISVYQEYSNTASKQLEHLLLLHNENDVTAMPQLLSMFAYSSLFQGGLECTSFEIHSYINIRMEQKQEACFSFDTDRALPKRISCGKGNVYMTANKNCGRIKVEICKDELKYFFPNYRDYYYLPMEDASIHKSVAFYVDKNFRTKAKAANCYSKKNGLFLPQEEELITPFFKKDYNDKRTYFEITDEFSKNTDVQKKYITHLLKYLST